MYDVLALAPTTSSEDPDYDDLTVDGGEVQQMLNWVNDNLFTIYEARTGTLRSTRYRRRTSEHGRR